jgi:hypothetical protein
MYWSHVWYKFCWRKSLFEELNPSSVELVIIVYHVAESLWGIVYSVQFKYKCCSDEVKLKHMFLHPWKPLGCKIFPLSTSLCNYFLCMKMLLIIFFWSRYLIIYFTARWINAQYRNTAASDILVVPIHCVPECFAYRDIANHPVSKRFKF